MDIKIIDSMSIIIGAAAGLGTAAFGIVETMKSRSVIGLAGFSHIKRLLGPLLTRAVRQAYGQGYTEMVRAQYKSDQRELRRTLRQGVRVGLTSNNAEELAEFVGVIDQQEMDAFISAAQKAILRSSGTSNTDDISPNKQLTDHERMLLARYELAVDGRIEAALSVAQTSYACTARAWAMIISMFIALIVGISTAYDNPNTIVSHLFNAIIIGLLAVPVAPIAKDLSEAIKSVKTGLRG